MHNAPTPGHENPMLASPAPEASVGRARRARTTSRSRLTVPLLMAALAATACAHTPAERFDACTLDIPKHDALVRVPFDTVDGRIYVMARVNGRGPFRFAVDTGASGLGRADASLVSALGLPVSGETTTSDGVRTAQVDTARIDMLELGGLARSGLDVITRDYNSRNAPDARFSGIIAREFFADGLLVIDYPARTLTFSRTHALPPAGKNVLRYERAFRIPVSIGAVQTLGQLDTGANVAFVLPHTLYQQVATGALKDAGPGQLTNGAIETGRAVVQGPFRVGTVSLSDVDVRVSARFPELLVGAHALQKAVVLIDQRSKRVAVCR